MRLFWGCAMALLLGTGAALADGHSSHEPRIYPVHTSHNYCPAGLQPVTIDGTICCGRPNQHMSYQQVMAHAAAKHRRSARVSRVACPVGQKGCN